MSNAPQTESAPDYASALERVRKLRQNLSAEHSHPKYDAASSFRLKSALPRVRNLLSAIGFHSSADDAFELQKKTALAKLSDGLLQTLIFCFFLALSIGLITQVQKSTATAFVSSAAPPSGAPTRFEYRNIDSILTRASAISVAHRALIDAGYTRADLALAPQPVSLDSQTSPQDGFVRLDDNNGYLIFQKKLSPKRLVKVLLTRSGRYIHATILDSGQ